MDRTETKAGTNRSKTDTKGTPNRFENESKANSTRSNHSDRFLFPFDERGFFAGLELSNELCTQHGRSGKLGSEETSQILKKENPCDRWRAMLLRKLRRVMTFPFYVTDYSEASVPIYFFTSLPNSKEPKTSGRLEYPPPCSPAREA